jgi:hypothetical protein
MSFSAWCKSLMWNTSHEAKRRMSNLSLDLWLHLWREELKPHPAAIVRWAEGP